MPFLVSMKFDKPASLISAKAGHIDRQGIVINKEVAIPELLHHVIACYDTACMFKEDTQDLKFILGQLDDFPFIHQVRGLEIEDGLPGAPAVF